jgi:VanZ family protein
MITVFCFSNQQGETSGNTSGRIIKVILKIFSKDISEEQVQKLQLPIRKLAHFTIYAIGGTLAILLLNQYNIPLIQKILYSQLIISAYAMLDEFHQSFIPGRTASLWDVLIDSTGALTAILLITLIFIRK